MARRNVTLDSAEVNKIINALRTAQDAYTKLAVSFSLGTIQQSDFINPEIYPRLADQFQRQANDAGYLIHRLVDCDDVILTHED